MLLGDSVIAAAIALGIVVAIVAGLHNWASTPVVYYSWSTGECVKIISSEGEHGCGAVESGALMRYEREWVK